MDLFCENCGTKLDEDSAFCINCGHKINKPSTENQQPTQQQSTQNQQPRIERQPFWMERNHILPGIVTLADGEEVVKEYACTQLKRPKCQGTLSVTNKRIIFHGKGRTSRIQKEVPIKLVSGLDTYYGINFDFIKIIIGVFILMGVIMAYDFMSQIPFSEGSNMYLGLIYSAAVGIFFIWWGIQPCFILSLYATGKDGMPIQIGTPPISSIGNGALYSLKAVKSAETDLMMKELGAMVEELQTMGDMAIEKWKR